MITVANQGQLITSTTYFGSEYELAGKLYCSINAGAIRVLLPKSQQPIVDDLRTAKYVICSRGPWPEQGLDEAVELLWEDGTDSPFAWQLSPESFDFLPAKPEAGQEWVCSVWTNEDGKPHKAIERPCKWRRSKKLPDLSPWKD